MAEKKQKVIALTVRMSRENIYRLKEKALRERLKLREYVHHALGLKLDDGEIKKEKS